VGGLSNTAQGWNDALVTIDRTVTGGLNSLTSADSLSISIDYSPDGGTTWRAVAGSTLVGGVMVTKGTLTTERLAIGLSGLPAGIGVRLNTDASTPVRIAGTVTYE
jgi:hypothetical protein